MSRLNKSFFQTLKNKSVVFKEVNAGEDVRIQVVDRFGDYKVEVLKRKANIHDTIRVKFVNVGADVKLEVVDRHGDFSIFME